MLKKLKIILFLALISALAFGYLIYRSRLTQITPYPYVVKKTQWSEASKALSSNVLIIGDRMGVNLDAFTPALVDKLSRNLKSKIRVHNWSSDKEGLHRSLARLKSLPSLPKIILYHGGSRELYEQKFLVQDRDVIKDNILTYRDESKLSLIITYPPLSRFLYKRPTKYFFLDQIIEDQNEYDSIKRQRQLEVSYELFQLELEELITLTKEKNSTLILMTSPIDLDSPPKEVCENAQTGTIQKEHQRLEKLLKANRSKEALQDLLILSSQTPGNARGHYLLGQAYRSLGQLQKAKIELTKAAAFDCSPWRATPVHNSIIRKMSKKSGTLLIDFDQSLQYEYGKNELFLHDLFPQNLYYRKIISELSDMIEDIYQI